MKKLMNVMKAFTDPKSPKVELRFVYYDFDNKKLVATDTRRLLVVEYELNVNEPVFIDVNNTGLGTSPLVVNNFIAYPEKEIGVFPKYERVLLENSKITKQISNELTFTDCIINVGSITGKKILVKYNKKYDKLNLYQEKTQIYYDEPNTPFMVSGLVDFGSSREKLMLQTKIVIMPLKV